MRESRSRFCLCLWNGFDRGQEFAQSAAGEERVPGGANEVDGNVVSGTAVLANREARFFGFAGKQNVQFDVVAWHGLTNFFENGRGILVVKRFAEALPFQLMRQDAQKVEVAARAHNLGGF